MSQYLIKTVDELKEHISFAYTEKGFDKVKPFILLAQEEYIKPQLCETLYEELLNYADPLDASASGSASASASGSGSAATATTDAWLAKLLVEARRSLAFFTLFEGFPALEVQFSADGVHRVEDDNYKSIHSGQRARLEKALLKNGFNRLEGMITFLEKNKTQFETWTTSTCYTTYKGRVVRSAVEFTEYWSDMANKRLTYNALLSNMRKVEKFTLKQLLGKDLHTEWFAQRAADNLSETNADLLEMMQAIVVSQSVHDAMPTLSLCIEAYGVFTPLITGNERNVQELARADERRFDQVRAQLLSDAEARKVELRNYLNANYSDYPLYDYDEDKTTNTGSLTGQEDKGIVGF